MAPAYQLKGYLESKKDMGLVGNIKFFDRSGNRRSGVDTFTKPIVMYLCNTTRKVWERILRVEVERYVNIMEVNVIEKFPIQVADKYLYGKKYVIVVMCFKEVP